MLGICNPTPSVYTILYLLHRITLTITQEAIFTVTEHPKENFLLGNILDAANIAGPVQSVILDDLDGNLIRFFRIDRGTGDLYTTAKAEIAMDREKICQDGMKITNPCFINLLAAVNNRLIVKLKIFITDINDNGPIFPLAPDGTNRQIFDIDEDSKPNLTRIILKPASDPDLDSTENGLYYYLSPKTSPFQLFINKTHGKNFKSIDELYLLLKEPLDFETETEYQLNLTACDGKVYETIDSSTKIHCISQMIDIRVNNLNDERPIFDQKQYELKVHETTPVNTVLFTFAATDQDAAPFNIVKYHLTHDSPATQEIFSINSVTGDLILSANDLDPGEYRVYVEASDLKQTSSVQLEKIVKNSRAVVNIHVLDDNNHQPRIMLQASTDLADIVMYENRPAPRVLAHLKVLDADFGPNAEVTCRLSLPNMHIHLFNITQISKLSEHISIFRLIQLVPIDAESFLNDSTFIRDRTTHNVSRKRAGKLGVVVVCKDHGNPPMRSRLHLDIDIVDEDEYEPRLFANIPGRYSQIPISKLAANDSYTFKFDLSEDTSIGSVVLKLWCEDDDATSVPVFTLRDSRSYFSINNETGEIVLMHPVDFELMKHHSLEISVGEIGSEREPIVVTINVTITDANDNAPVFVHPPLINPNGYHHQPVYMKQTKFDGIRSLHSNEEMEIGRSIGRVQAVDADSGSNAQLDYFIVEQCAWKFAQQDGTSVQLLADQSIPFLLNVQVDGNLTISGRLDREFTPFIDLLIGVHDHGQHRRLTSFTSVRVIIDDVNDHAPEWQFPKSTDYIILVWKSLTVGQTVTRVRATDRDDSKLNGRITYSMRAGIMPSLGNKSSSTNLVAKIDFSNLLFHLDNTSGVLRVRKPLSSLPEGFIDIWLQASDSGTVRKTTMSKLVIYLTDRSNDGGLSVRLLEDRYNFKPQYVRDKMKIWPHRDIAALFSTDHEGAKLDELSDSKGLPSRTNSLIIFIGIIIGSLLLIGLLLFGLIALRVHTRAAKCPIPPLINNSHQTDDQVLAYTTKSCEHYFEVPTQGLRMEESSESFLSGETLPNRHNYNSDNKQVHPIGHTLVQFTNPEQIRILPIDPSTTRLTCSMNIDGGVGFGDLSSAAYTCTSTRHPDVVLSEQSAVPAQPIPIKLVSLSSPMHVPMRHTLDTELESQSFINAATLPSLLSSLVPVCHVQHGLMSLNGTAQHGIDLLPLHFDKVELDAGSRNSEAATSQESNGTTSYPNGRFDLSQHVS